MEDYGNRDWEHPCMCGHIRTSHVSRGLAYGIYEHVCIDYRTGALCGWHPFKLDNLALVEQIARARKLV